MLDTRKISRAIYFRINVFVFLFSKAIVSPLLDKKYDISQRNLPTNTELAFKFTTPILFRTVLIRSISKLKKHASMFTESGTFIRESDQIANEKFISLRAFKAAKPWSAKACANRGYATIYSCIYKRTNGSLVIKVEQTIKIIPQPLL